MNAWIILTFAMICEVCASTALKQGAISGNKLYTLAFVVLMGTSFALLFQALKTLDLSIAYAVWAGAGLVVISCVGFAVFNEAITALKVVFIACILVGVVGLKLVSNA